MCGGMSQAVAAELIPLQRQLLTLVILFPFAKRIIDFGHELGRVARFADGEDEQAVFQPDRRAVKAVAFPVHGSGTF
jgi:predicted DCC family thiol-disulfide oxidoreductase YuxK